MSLTQYPIVYLVLHSGWAARFILLLLLLMSVVVVAAIFFKIRQFRVLAAADREFYRAFRQTRSFEELPVVVSRTRGEGYRAIAENALVEEERFDKGLSIESRTLLVEEALERGMEEQRTAMEVWLSSLVVCASAGPFLGLLGTVWGITDAFFQIGNQGSASLNVVAPGVAEALVTTLGGLIVALPAAAGHQFLTAQVRKQESRNVVFASEVLSLFRRGAESR